MLRHDAYDSYNATAECLSLAANGASPRCIAIETGTHCIGLWRMRGKENQQMQLTVNDQKCYVRYASCSPVPPQKENDIGREEKAHPNPSP